MRPDGTPRRALAIVAKYPRPGRVKTRLAATIGAERAARLYRAFLLDLAARFTPAASREGHTLIWAHTPDPGNLREIVGAGGRLLIQRGHDLAERLHQICADLAAVGYQQVVIISSDSPHLPAASVRDAFAALGKTPVALAPCEDGGYSLIGLRATPRVPELFRGIRMSTPRVCADTLARATALGLAVRQLPTTFDVDEAPDLCRLAVALGRPGAGVAEAPHTSALLIELGIGGVADHATPL